MKCTLCPRKCNTDRTQTVGVCTSPAAIKVARAALHHWEEPCISGSKGSGTVFFSGCPLGCVFCQNREISRLGVGREISPQRLGEIFMELQRSGAHNINLVSPTQYTDQIVGVLDKTPLSIPVAVNTGGYETETTLEKWRDTAQIFMPDLKCVSRDIGARYMHAPDYFEVAIKAIKKMHQMQPEIVMDADGVMQKGVIVRHLVLPGHKDDSIRVLDALHNALPKDGFLLSLMSQFTPNENCANYPEINRRITTYEYKKVADHALRLGMQGFMQERSSAKEEYTPPFDLTGV
ncbi:MAG: radical SAM protein [Clostridia bacterium]|nr:radical SAM protein [Clostridia bacterium]